MKILLLSSSFHGGGITSFAHEVSNAFSSDNDFSIILGSDEKVPINNGFVHKYYYDCDNLSIKNSKAIITLINNTINPDVIIGSNAKILPIIAQFLNQNINIITVSHSLKYAEADVAAVAHRYCDHIIAGSKYNLDYMSQRFHIKDHEKISVIYNFVKEYSEREIVLNRKLAVGPVSIVFVGGCAASKTPELIVQIIRNLIKTDVNFKFNWIGGNYIHLSRHFPFLRISDVRDLIPEDSRVSFTGRLPTREDAENVLASANILLAPSRREGCPMSFLEAIRVGVIAVVADYPNFNREIVEKGGFGYVCSHKDVNSFTSRIEDICNNPQKYIDMYDKAYQTYRNELSFETWKTKMDALVYSSSQTHKTRYQHVSNITLFLNVLRVKRIIIEGRINETIHENLKVLYRMWKLKKKEIL